MGKFNLAFLMLILFGISPLLNAQSKFTCYVRITNDRSKCIMFDLSPAVMSVNQTIAFNPVYGDITGYVFLQVAILYPSVANSLPLNLFTYFPVMQTLLIGNASLNTLVSNNFGNCSQLSSIGLVGNTFTFIPGSFASNCKLVTLLNITLGGLQSFDAKAFQGLDNLETLNLYGNYISTIPSGLFSMLKKLTRLDLSSNRITALDPITFNGLTALSWINCTNNSITNIPAFDFSSNNMIDGITFLFEMNQVNSIDSQFFNIWPAQNVKISFQRPIGSSCIPPSPQVIDKTSYAQCNLAYLPCFPTTTTKTTASTATTATNMLTQYSSEPAPGKGVTVKKRKRCYFI